jgi:hypothetical protein
MKFNVFKNLNLGYDGNVGNQQFKIKEKGTQLDAN